jgi:hypothetical protein
MLGEIALGERHPCTGNHAPTSPQFGTDLTEAGYLRVGIIVVVEQTQDLRSRDLIGGTGIFLARMRVKHPNQPCERRIGIA